MQEKISRKKKKIIPTNQRIIPIDSRKKLSFASIQIDRSVNRSEAARRNQRGRGISISSLATHRIVHIYIYIYIYFLLMHMNRSTNINALDICSEGSARWQGSLSFDTNFPFRLSLFSRKLTTSNAFRHTQAYKKYIYIYFYLMYIYDHLYSPPR